jgi:hypothetical protein
MTQKKKLKGEITQSQDVYDKGKEGELTQSNEAEMLGELKESQPSLEGELQAVESANVEIVVVIEYDYFKRELTDDEREMVRTCRAFINLNKKIVISPWKENKELKMNQRQADLIDIVEKLEKMPLTTGYLAKVKYSQ